MRHSSIGEAEVYFTQKADSVTLRIRGQQETTEGMMKVGAGKYTYEVIEDFAKLPEGETFGLISRLTTDSQDRLYVFQRKDPAVLVFDPDGKFLRSWGQPGKTAPGEFHLPHTMAISPDGTLYVSDRANARVQMFTPDGKFIGMWTGMGGPNDMARDQNGIFYLCEQATATSKHAISVRDGNGAVLTRWETPHSHGMGIDSSGNIYVGLTKEPGVNKYVRTH
jgi:DNA-binding beta-propeller fold protein YncE